MKKITIIKKTCLKAAFIVAMMAPLAGSAQTGFEDNVDDQGPPPSPINTYVLAGILAGGALGYVAIAKKNPKKA